MLRIIAAVLSVVITIGITTTPFMAIATLSYSVMVAGYWQRLNRILHVRLMVSAILIDLILVLILEIQRHAIETAMSMKFGPLQQAHIFSSATATALYFPVLAMGFYLWNNPSAKIRNWHVRIGKAAFFFRTLGFILMFTLLLQERS
ncbi:MAG: hypothetical protein A4S09_01035 [Proteobacteria bacterium SG_bin7]|nr:MAG: hypothetical protein A4S09_01035 [Proteobacteria bacterium SG_bin7]